MGVQPNEPSLFATNRVETLNRVPTRGRFDVCQACGARRSCHPPLRSSPETRKANRGMPRTALAPPYLQGHTLQGLRWSPRASDSPGRFFSSSWDEVSFTNWAQ